MDTHVTWYTQEKSEVVASILLEKQFVLYRSNTLKEAQEKMIDILKKQHSEDSICFGDTLIFSDSESSKNLKKSGITYTDKHDQSTLLSKVVVLEAMGMIEDGEIVLYGDFNVSAGIFGAETVYIFLATEHSFSNKIQAIQKIEQMSQDPRLSTIEGTGVGFINNGRKFDRRIQVLLYNVHAE